MHPAHLGRQSKTQREVGYSRTPGSGDENACVQEWSMDMGVHSPENWLSIFLRRHQILI